MTENEVRGFSYDVALSFAGEDRAIVDRFAKVLKENGVSVFYDDWERPDLWGKDLYQHLAEVYGEAARFCIIFVSQHYAQKAWTNHELRSAQARAFQQNLEYILPVRLDDTEIKGVPATTGYIDLKSISIDDLAQLVIAKLQAIPGSELPPVSAPEATTPFRIPRVPRASINLTEEAHKLIARLEALLDERVPVFRDAGLNVDKTSSDGSGRVYRITYGDRFVYFLSMRVNNEFGREVVSFLDGWNEPSNLGAATAYGTIQETLDHPEPRVQLTNFSLLDQRGVSPNLSYDELGEAIWNKACNVIEGIVRQLR